jgi:hypothetical protein
MGRVFICSLLFDRCIYWLLKRGELEQLLLPFLFVFCAFTLFIWHIIHISISSKVLSGWGSLIVPPLLCPFLPGVLCQVSSGGHHPLYIFCVQHRGSSIHFRVSLDRCIFL